jgi:hypothetical protein
VKDETNNEINDSAVRKLFEGKNFVYIASLMRDGSPHVNPTWVDIENSMVLVNTVIGRTKHSLRLRIPIFFPTNLALSLVRTGVLLEVISFQFTILILVI